MTSPATMADPERVGVKRIVTSVMNKLASNKAAGELRISEDQAIADLERASDELLASMLGEEDDNVKARLGAALAQIHGALRAIRRDIELRRERNRELDGEIDEAALVEKAAAFLREKGREVK